MRKREAVNVVRKPSTQGRTSSSIRNNFPSASIPAFVSCGLSPGCVSSALTVPSFAAAALAAAAAVAGAAASPAATPSDAGAEASPD